ncbi:hypothetical protein B0H19DRAFT_1261219 [Mycena capillaripes]|nr:hypothetical protein B0H19DRAFT_1261219 [Mycena capillaripes]
MSKLEFPELTESLTLPATHGWLGHCEDTYEAWQAMNPDRSIAPGTLITLAGLKMEESTAATWWNENRMDLKALKSWELFAQKVKDRFVPSNWCMAALAAFHAIQQGSSMFPKFADSLQNAQNSLTGAGVGYTISDSILKNHLLFHSHPILRLRVSGLNDLPFATMKVDNLIATMSSTWDSLIAEGFTKLPRTAAPAPLVTPSAPAVPSQSLPTPTSASPAFVPLTHTEKEALWAAHGCYHCRKTPQTPGWTKHRSDNCPSLSWTDTLYI